MSTHHQGLRPVAVAEKVGDKWHFMGMMSLFDPPRDDTKIVIEAAIRYGASVKMITGDHQLIAKETCRRLGMGDSIMKPDSLKLPEGRLMQLIEDCDGFAAVGCLAPPPPPPARTCAIPFFLLFFSSSLLSALP
jgi:H+-transporting ATPase